MDSFVNWCELNRLQLNVSKTKELVVDLRRTWSPVNPMTMMWADVEIVQDYKYLGACMDNRLDWSKNSIGCISHADASHSKSSTPY